ncbi:MAG: DNA translocase FtsK [Candidatus Marinimicrobia bacterium]|nr:DNA translocase FtsK [Candidatus Neomarinimicrobiota bacterium]|tara:strand:- start:4540 stop:6837 length:2298 start_codon:yes stop_codon:yes gene_type:complete
MKRKKQKLINNKLEILGILIMSLSIMLVISIIGWDSSEQPNGLFDNSSKNSWFGNFGIYVAYYQTRYLIGYYTLIFNVLFFYVGFLLFSNKGFKNQSKFFSYSIFIALWLSVFKASILAESINYDVYSGLIGFLISNFLFVLFKPIGSFFILFISGILIIANVFNFSIYSFLSDSLSFLNKRIKLIFNRLFYKKNNIEINQTDENSFDRLVKPETEDESLNFEDKGDEVLLDDEYEEENLEYEEENFDSLEEQLDENSSDVVIEEEVSIDEGEFQNKNKLFKYNLPEIDFLDEEVEIENHDEELLRKRAEDLIYALDSFGVSGKVVKISPGPVITLYEIEPAEGVRVNKFINLSEDLSRIMGGKRVRIIAPIPHSKSVGIELPNENPKIVYLKNIINSKAYIDNPSRLKIALGKTTTGDAFIFELNKMPHLLVAGATGAGKSVCINTIIISILYNAKPNEVKFILMDPKKVELSTYKSLVGYHLMTASNLDEYVMTSSKNAVSILDSAITEMERRFQIFSDVRVRNIEEYFIKRNADKTLEEIPYIVVVIDELADLMMTSGRAIEEPITRLAQKARAVGIHLIVATQRPSVDVITGLIKSNFPARISFQVSSKVDSRTIIDQIGAEKLLGRGDMLFLRPGTASPIRLHNAYVTLDEIEKIMNHVTSQSKPTELKLPEVKKNESDGSDLSTDINNQDDLLIDAAKLVVDYQQASVSLLQRKFRIGYSRAGRLVDELESLGIVSGHSGSKAREVLVGHDYLDELFDK